MKAVSPVLPHSDFTEVTLAEHQPQYNSLPVVVITYDDGTRSMISHYKLSYVERLYALFYGSLWLEQLTFGAQLQPQRPTFREPFHDE